jgi:site-specific recombinase XerD
MTALAPTLQAFFTDRLIQQRHASPQTVAAYRDAIKLLLAFVEQRTGEQPSELDFAQLDVDLVGAFLDHLERERGNSPRTRNARLAAIHSLFRFAALRHPEHAASIARVLTIPPKRFERPVLTYLTDPEIDALLGAPSPTTWTGRRDHALLLLATQTGLRASEITGLNCGDIHVGSGAHVSSHGKGRKERITPLTRHTCTTMRAWLTERAGQPADPLFPTSQGTRLGRDALEHRLTKYLAIAAKNCPTLATKRITMHTLRHTAAMRLLHAGVDTTVIALWLGHESVDTTKLYLHADLALKERAITRTTPPHSKPGRYQPPDNILSFLQNL